MKKLVPEEKLIFRPAAYALIVNDGQVLLLTNRRTGKYALPGGAPTAGERLLDALKREVKEETGLEIQIEKFLFWAESFFYYDPLDEAYHSLSFFYRCKPLTLNLIPDDQVDDSESTKPRWIEIEQVRAKDIQSFGKEIVGQLGKLK